MLKHCEKRIQTQYENNVLLILNRIFLHKDDALDLEEEL